MSDLSRRLGIRGFVLLLTTILLPLTFAAESGRTAQFRKPLAGATTDVEGGLPEAAFGLKVAWTRPLGSGYSNVWLEGGTAVTMFTAGEVDVVAAFDAAKGGERWRYELGPKYAGHDGSDDGPLGTPTVSDGTVYALGPSGQLVALSLANGKEQWRKTLNEENSTTPRYGYTASPVVYGNNVIVATGGEGHAVTAFDRATGEQKWASGDDSVTYQTPMIVDLGGRKQLLMATDHLLLGLDPAGGQILWQLRHTEDGESNEAAHPTVIDGERFLVKYQRGARLYRYANGAVEEVWQTTAFGNTFALPVLAGDHLYGFSGNVLTCVSAKTGEIAWRSRDISAFGLAIEDGSLAVMTLDGNLVLVDPSPEGYREIARVQVFEAGNYAVPSFEKGQFIVRNLQQLAAVRVDTAVAPQVARIDPTERLKGDFGKWIASVEALGEGKRQAAVDSRLGGIEKTPLVDEDGHVHFVWRGEAEDVAVTGSIVEGGGELGLYRLAGTDLFYRSVQLDPKAQYTYGFAVDFGTPAADPRNPHTVDNGFGVASDLRMSAWPAAPHLDPPAEGAARGTLDSFPFRSEILENTRQMQVWRPADYASDPERRYPVLIVNHGDNLVRGGLMRNTLDNLVGTRVAPLIAVFVPRTNPAEYGGPAASNYTRFLVEELLPHIDRHYRTDTTRRAIMGPGSAGVASILTAFERPDVFRMAATQSFYPIDAAQERLPGMIAGADPKPELIYVVWSRHDYDLGDGRRADESSRQLIEQVRQAGIKVVEQVSDYSPGWGGWRGQDDEILAALFPLQQ